MMRGTIGALAVAAFLLGLAHVGLTPVIYAKLDLNALWFAGSGLALVMAGLLNLLGTRVADDGIARAILLVGNLATLAFLVVTWRLLNEPQVIAGVVLFAALAAASALPNKAGDRA